MAQFTDLFSDQAAAYARHRPTYPPELFAFIADCAPQRAVVWDCATGNGQAAHGLRRHFGRVIATDASEQQIANARAADGIEYRLATAEASGLADASVDAITVATAFHWFDQDAFALEAQRVGRPGAVVAVWTYANSDMPARQQAVVEEFVGPVLKPYWSPKIEKAWGGYSALPFPFEPVDAPPFEIRREWTVDEFVDYASTWSAAQEFVRQNGENPFTANLDVMRTKWGAKPVVIRWPLDLRVGRVL